MSNNIYIKNKKLFFTKWENFLYKLISFSFFTIFGSSTLILIFSPYPKGKALGFLFFLILGERLLYGRKGDRTVLEIYSKGGDISDALTPASLMILNNAFNAAKKREGDFYLALLEELLNYKEIVKVLKRLDISPDDFLQTAHSLIGIKSDNERNYEEIVQKMLFAALENALENNDIFIYPRNIFASIVTTKDEDVLRLLNNFGIEEKDLNAAVIFGKWKSFLGGINFLPKSIGEFVKIHYFSGKRTTMSRDWTAKPTPTLDSFSVDLTDLARRNKIGFLIGHQKEFERLLDILSRPQKPNALLVGEAGVGKSTIIDHLARRLVKDEVPEALFDKRLVSLKVGDLISGVTQEELAERILTIANEIIMAGNIILFIPNMHDLFRTSSTSLNAIDLFIPAIKGYSIPIIGETYPQEFKKYIESNSDFLEQFEVIRVEEITEEEAKKFLIYKSVILEKQYKIFIPFSVIKRVVYLAKRYFHQKPLPGSASDLLEQVLGKIVRENEKKVTVKAVDEIAERISAIPIQKADSEETEKLLNLEEIIHRKFINQDVAVKAVARALREYRSGLSRKGGPIASFLFVGPTGVGKTELSKILAEIQFGSKNSMVRFDMSEFQDKLSIYKLLGQPDGSSYGMLTEEIFEHPYSLILLDEFEKAHPDILNIFLQIFDDGRVTDSLGKTVNFENTIIIATSNANSEFIKEELEKGKKVEEISIEIKKRLVNFFKPELLNRFSDIVVFRDLNKEEIKQIAGLLMNDLSKTLREEKGISIMFDDDVLRVLAEKGYDPVFGARPLRKVISEEIKGILAEEILRSQIKRGDMLKIIFKDDRFTFVKVQG